jgi:phosphatidylserine/phosphatidylglycerophosphate/cardiolipin synthase-like enzyme
VLLDWVGSTRLDKAALDKMKDAGVEVERYHEPHWSHLPRLNNRTHRKILVVDGKVGYTGGVGIADKWRGDAQDAEHWRDTTSASRPGGRADAVGVQRQLDQGDRRVLHGKATSRRRADAGGMPAQMFSSSPSGGAESMHLMYLLAITAAKTSIELSNSYFVPDELTIRALVEAARRGVRVRIIVPARSSIPTSSAPRRAPTGAAARGRRPDRRVPADDVPLQGARRRRLVHLGRLDQLRQPVVPHQRRGEPEPAGREVRRRAGEGVRARPVALEGGHARGLARPAMEGARDRVVSGSY